MSNAIDRAVSHIDRTVSALPNSIITSFPEMASAVFVNADKAGGVRLPLGALVGRSRVFEIDLDDLEVVPLQSGQGVPSSFNLTVTLRVRYDAQGAGVKDSTKILAAKEQVILSKALNGSNWTTVSGLVNLFSEQGTIRTGTAVDDAGSEFVFVLSEISVDLSVDM